MDQRLDKIAGLIIALRARTGEQYSELLEEIIDIVDTIDYDDHIQKGTVPVTVSDVITKDDETLEETLGQIWQEIYTIKRILKHDINS